MLNLISFLVILKRKWLHCGCCDLCSSEVLIQFIICVVLFCVFLNFVYPKERMSLLNSLLRHILCNVFWRI